MRLVRLLVERFAAVREARVEFGPGLNVLYGPNDLGKSTLAKAIRAALLVPCKSQVGKEFIEWETDETPRVELVFQTPDQRYWRIRKAFSTGTGGSATLEGSADGQSWASEAKGRRVDGEVRKLLRWGIPEPGGQGVRIKGMPESFITSALLAGQAQTGSIFETSLDDDPDESGKKRLAHALEALAQDPLFRTALDAAHEKVGEAFTAKGNKKRGASDPFRRARDEIRRAQEDHDDSRSELNNTMEVEARRKSLSDESLRAKSAAEDTGTCLQELEAGFQRQTARAEISQLLDAARHELTAVERDLQRVTDGEAEERQCVIGLAEADEHLAKSKARHATAIKKLEDVQATVRRLQNNAEAREQEVQRETAALQHQRLELDGEAQTAAIRADKAAAAGDLVGAVATLAQQVAELQERVDSGTAELDRRRRAEASAEAEMKQLAGVALFEQWRKAAAEAKSAETARETAATLRKEAAGFEAKARAADEEMAGRNLPSDEELLRLRKLHGELGLATAALGVGLSVSVRLQQSIDLSATADDDDARAESDASGEHTFAAERRLELTLGGVADVVITGGAAAAREKVSDLRAVWENDGAPILTAAGVTSVTELEAACREAATLRESAAQWRGEARLLEASAAKHDATGTDMPALAARVAERSAALEAFDREELEAIAAGLSADREVDLEQRRNAAQTGVEHRKDETRACEIAGAEARAELDAQTQRLREDTARRDAAVAELNAPWETVLADDKTTLKTIAAQQASIAATLAKLDRERDTEIEAAEQDQADTERELTTFTTEQDETAAAREDAVRRLETTRGELTVRRERATTLDVQKDRTTVATLQAQLEGSEAPETPITAAELDAARAAADTAQRGVRAVLDEIKKSEGALEQVGGAVAREREKLTREALDRARDHEAELELDYGAWQLLRDTLREVENQESAHLGRALIGPISEEFTALTKGRYGNIEIEPDLTTKGIGAAGHTRGIDALSVGLREQLATIFRISVAQHLQSVLVLDDQLTQTDESRTAWFREVLRGCAAKIQIIVLTCRASDYLSDAEMVAGDATFADGASGKLRAVDLERVVVRAGTPD